MVTSVQIRRGPVGRPRKASGSPTHRRVTEQTGHAEASNWYHAVQFADGVLQRPLNLHVIVHWRFAPSGVSEFDRVQHLLNLVGQWQRRQGFKPVWAYARENGTARTFDGLHLHLLIHVPGGAQGGRGKDFIAAVRGWVATSSDDFEDRAVKSVWIRDDGVVSYCLKEGTDDVHAAYGVWPVHRKRRNGHPVPGKRMGVSHSIHATARRIFNQNISKGPEARSLPQTH